MADVIDGGAFNVLEVTENGNARWWLVFEGNAAENALTLNSNATSNVANIEPDGTIYLGAQQSTLAKNTSHRLNVQGPASTGAWISTFANNSYPTFQLYRTNNTSIGSARLTAKPTSLTRSKVMLLVRRIDNKYQTTEAGIAYLEVKAH